MTADVLRFNDLELDLRAYELRRDGHALKLERIPMELLCLLAENQGQLVTREQIIQQIWGKDVFLDTDNSINTAIRKIRQALNDNPEMPRFIQTISGKGYRFAAPITRSPTTARKNIILRDSSQPVMLAVLPFENLSNDAEQEYFSDGLTEETITHLGQLSPERMGVIARTSSMAYKRTTKTVSQIGHELKVDYVLEGSVRRENDVVRITAQLIRVADQIHLWAHSYERKLGTVLGVQSELGSAIAQEVELRLAPQQFSISRDEDPEAHDAYLRGRYHWAKRTYKEIGRAIEYFGKAVEKDPRYARAYAGLADCYIILPITSDMRSEDCFPKASAAAARALELDPALAEAHTSRGTIRFWFDWDWAGAEEAYLKALELNGNYAVARLYRAHCLSNIGKHGEALAEIRRGLRLDPLSPIMNTLYAEFLYHARLYEEALAQFHNALELNPDFWVARVNLAKAHEQTGHYDEAIAELQKARLLSDQNTETISLLGYVLAVSGEKQKAQGCLSELFEIRKKKYVPPYNIALLHLGLENKRAACESLEQGYQERDVHMTFLLDPKWDQLRNDPRFRKLIRQVGL
ncbi:MAG: winged helix-turn-helix domain-containing protein [Terriglobales bacterium]